MSDHIRELACRHRSLAHHWQAVQAEYLELACACEAQGAYAAAVAYRQKADRASTAAETHRRQADYYRSSVDAVIL